MNISSISNTLTSYQSNSITKQHVGEEVTNSHNTINTKPSYNFTSMSLNELNTLVKDGVFGDYFPPLVLPNGFSANNSASPSQQDFIYNTKVNYISHIENQIAVKQSLNLPTEEDKKFLSIMLNLQKGSSNVIDGYA